MAVSNESATSTEMPHLEVVERLSKLPFMQLAITQSTNVYSRLRESNSMITWTLSTAEATAKKAIEKSAPIARKLESPISVVDQTLCKGLNIVEDHLPIVKESPENVYNKSKTYVQDNLIPTIFMKAAVEKAHSLTALSWSKANEVLATRYGEIALNSFDQGAELATTYLDYYFPAEEDEKESEQKEETDDKVLHTVHTVGRLSNKMARRVYHSLSKQINHLDRTNIQEYVINLISVVQLTNYLDSLKYKKEEEEKSQTKEK